MPAVNLVVETPISTSMRARQLASIYDVPPAERASLAWNGPVPIEDRPWNVGLIVGPSGSGKTSIMRQLWGEMPELTYGAAGVVDDVAKGVKLEDITAAFGAVGFNTVPAWFRPYAVLSNGEKFRADIARRMIELPDPIVVDEFTSVVDRQVAQIASFAIAKAIRKRGRQFVAVSCHHDIIDWLQPDWILEPATMTFTWRSVQPRPVIHAEIRRVHYSMWELFAKYHYMTQELHRSSRCFCMFVNDRPVAFSAFLHRPHARVKDIMGATRGVTLPDWQGVGLIMAMVHHLGGAYKALGYRLHTYASSPPFARSFDRSPEWKLSGHQQTGTNFGIPSQQSRAALIKRHTAGNQGMTLGSSRASTVFEFVGPAMDLETARLLIGKDPRE